MYKIFLFGFFWFPFDRKILHILGPKNERSSVVIKLLNLIIISELASLGRMNPGYGRGRGGGGGRGGMGGGYSSGIWSGTNSNLQPVPMATAASGGAGPGKIPQEFIRKVLINKNTILVTVICSFRIIWLNMNHGWLDLTLVVLSILWARVYVKRTTC